MQSLKMKTRCVPPSFMFTFGHDPLTRSDLSPFSAVNGAKATQRVRNGIAMCLPMKFSRKYIAVEILPIVTHCVFFICRHAAICKLSLPQSPRLEGSRAWTLAWTSPMTRSVLSALSISVKACDSSSFFVWS